jgi:hypothetical protein
LYFLKKSRASFKHKLMAIGLVIYVFLLCTSTGHAFQQTSSMVVSSAGMESSSQVPISFVSDDGLVCFEGFDEMEVDEAVSFMRATPMYQLFAHSGFTVGQSCQGLGYETLIAERDQCFGTVSSWVRQSGDFQAFEASMHVVEEYGLRRGLQSGTATRWSSCVVCRRVGVLWGQQSAADCEGFSNELVASELQSARSATGSFIPDNGAVCFEGELDYVTAALTRTATTPFGVIFTQAGVSEQTCEERGYPSARDVIDECWPEAVKFMRILTQGQDMGTWVGSYPTAISAHDALLGLPEGTSQVWTACQACEPGGAVRDRGMWITWDGGLSEPVTDEMCQRDWDALQLTQTTREESLAAASS